MKTLIKTIMSLAMVAIVAMTAPMASAAYSINTMADDCMTVTIANHTTGAGVADPCWTNSTINAKVGDIVNVAIYYDNSGTTAAPNVSFKLTNPQDRTIPNNGSVSMTGSILVNGSVVKSGNVTLNVTGGPSELVFGSLVKYEHRTGINAPVSGAGIFTSGYVLGNMEAGESGQGVIKANFLVVAANGSPVDPTPNPTGIAPNVATSNYSGYNSTAGNVTINGTFDSNGYATTTSFLYRPVGGSWVTVGSTNRGTGSGSFSYPLTSLPSGTYEYKAHASNAYGEVDGSIFTFTISRDGNTTSCPSGFYWNGTYCVQNVTTCPSGYYLSGNTCIQNVTSCPSGYYLSGNTCIQNVTVSQLASVSTLGTISVGGTAAAVDGYYTANGCDAYTSFRYGTTQSLGNTTGEVNRGNNSGSMAQSLSGLAPNTTYYYQAQVRNCAGTTTGSIRSFTTSGDTTRDTVIIRNVTNTTTVSNGTGGGNGSIVKLMIDNHRETIRGGKEIAYDVSWENLTNKQLKKLVLEINFPVQMTVVDTDHGSVERNMNSVIYQIDSLDAREKGTMTIIAQVAGNLKENDPVVAQAIAAFENPTTAAAENAIAYDADTYSTVTNGSVLGASIFGLNFLPTSLAGWLIILLILLIIVLIAHSYYVRNRTAPVVVNNGNVPQNIPVDQAPVAGNDYIVYRPTPKN